MDRRKFLCGLTLGTLAAPLAVKAQQAGKIPRIGLLMASPPDKAAHLIETFRQGLRDLGYVEGRDIVIEYRYAHGGMARFPALAADLVRLKVDIIVAPVDQANTVNSRTHCLILVDTFRAA